MTPVDKGFFMLSHDQDTEQLPMSLRRLAPLAFNNKVTR
ncbi:hypothetical protein BSIN_1519 [Burkholderia singularis]|uniref:Uncharacterized protein n=1 Tax=Burkholderia singularis TaxID=1503053 RepID=A0A238GZ03_9BURK|nr:hypothetical protein BSIN_1519 [Burkholderia singularis]